MRDLLVPDIFHDLGAQPELGALPLMGSLFDLLIKDQQPR